MKIEKTVLSTRKTAKEVVERMDSDDKLLDLTDVELVSPSFADQLRVEAEKRDIEIRANENIRSTLAAVGSGSGKHVVTA